MPQIFTILPGQPVATRAAEHFCANVPAEDWAKALLILPTRRACQILRQELMQLLAGKTSLLPRMQAIADLPQEMLRFAATDAQRAAFFSTSPAMPEWLRRSVLMAQIMAFERQRFGTSSVAQAMGLTDELLQLQDACAQHAVTLTPQALHQLARQEDTTHWQASLQFLEILSSHWPSLERSYGMVPASVRQTQLLQMLAQWWRDTPPDFPVWIIGSTGSQSPTAELMQVIAELSRGAVLLPGYDPRHSCSQELEEGHPYRHLCRWLAHWPDVKVEILGEQTTENIWLQALIPTAQVPQWRDLLPLTSSDVSSLKLIPCAQEEEEVRVVALLAREALEDAHRRVAIITPDEDFMARVAAHLAPNGIIPNRLSDGALAQTQAGQALLSLLAVLTEPESMAQLMQLFQHPLTMAQSPQRAVAWQYWCQSVEERFRGVVRHRLGQLPALKEAFCNQESYHIAREFVRRAAELNRAKLLPSAWLEALTDCQQLLEIGQGEGASNIAEALAELSHAQLLGPMSIEDFSALAQEVLHKSWRGGRRATHPNLSMLTPVEARLQQFHRVILPNMAEGRWPAHPQTNAWLNMAHQQRLGLPVGEDAISLAAHDILMLASGAEVFFTYALRDTQGPTAPSRFLERLLAMLNLRGVAPSALEAPHYITWAYARDAAAEYRPEAPALPRPSTAQRLQPMAVTALDYLFSDPYFLYARYVLQLKHADDFDQLPEPRDFGVLAHRAIEQLVLHWNETGRAATDDELLAMAQTGIAKFSDRSNVRLFWLHRLHQALAFVNAQEDLRRPHLSQVVPEQPIEASIPLQLADGTTHTLKLQGRIDRLERADENVIIADYKTGIPPKAADVLKGKTVQLLAYALLLGVPAELSNLSYWGLPGGKRDGKIHTLDAVTIVAESLLEQLRGALTQFAESETPLLARPQGTGWNARENPYDGISRYQEWAE